MTTIYTVVEWTDLRKENHCKLIASFRSRERAIEELTKAVDTYVIEDFGDEDYKPPLFWNKDRSSCEIGEDAILEVQSTLLED